MALMRSDYDQAARYLKYACELLEREAFGRITTIRHVLQLAMQRLSPGDRFVGDAAAEITVLRDLAGKGAGHRARRDSQGGCGAAGYEPQITSLKQTLLVGAR
jgi:hypothetical protein